MTAGFLAWLSLFIWADFLVIFLLFFIPTFRKVADLLGHRSELARFATYAFALIFIVALVVTPITDGWLMLEYVGFWTMLILAIIFMASPFNFLTTSVTVIAVWVTYRVLFAKGPGKVNSTPSSDLDDSDAGQIDNIIGMEYDRKTIVELGYLFLAGHL